MNCYIDSSFLAKLYYPEEGSQKLADWITRQRAPILFSSLHELELKNAFSLKAFRREITDRQKEEVFRLIDNDVEKGVLRRLYPDWSGVFLKAIGISKKYTLKTGARSLDVLHVAVAVSSKCTHFLSNDERQTQIAGKTGLSVLKL